MPKKTTLSGDALEHVVTGVSLPRILVAECDRFRSVGTLQAPRSVMVRQALELYLVVNGHGLPKGYDTVLDPRMLEQVKKTVTGFLRH